MMGKPLQPLFQDQKLQGKNNSYESKAKGVSISASIVSILVYISVFYIFNLSPSIIFNSSKFWFFLSNTLIIIIAADYGSFSSSSDRVDDPYDDYVAKSRQPMSAIYHQPYNYINTTPIPSSLVHRKIPHHEEDDAEEGIVEKKVISSPLELKEDDEEEEVPTQDSIWESISTKQEADHKVQKENSYYGNITNHTYGDHKRVTKFRRTVSEKLPATCDESKNAIHRWESSRHEPLVATDEEPEAWEIGGGEFAAMTDDELNRRVEEFIQKFNRHIRLERHNNF